jgi:hypothetical protein
MPGVVGPDEIRRVVAGALELSNVDGVEVLFVHEWGGLTRFASSSIHQSTWREDTGLRIRVVRGGRIGVAATNDLSPEGARAAAESAREMADVVAPDPLFAGLGRRPVLRQAHGRRLAAVPPGCALLASSPACRVQAFRRAGTLVYGVQFHPEAFTDAFPAGRRLLANFFALALASGDRDAGAP